MATHREMFWAEAGEGGRRPLGVTMKSRHGSQGQCWEYLRKPVLEGGSGRDKDWRVDSAVSRSEGTDSYPGLGGGAVERVVSHQVRDQERLATIRFQLIPDTFVSMCGFSSARNSEPYLSLSVSSLG